MALSLNYIFVASRGKTDKADYFIESLSSSWCPHCRQVLCPPTMLNNVLVHLIWEKRQKCRDSPAAGMPFLSSAWREIPVKKG